MHPNPAFRGAPEADALAFALARGFGTLALSGPDLPHLAHVPFCSAPEGEGGEGGGAGGGTLECHLVRSNPLARALRAGDGDGDGPARAILSVTGPDGYVSPDWYGTGDQVPTWNYVAVHLVVSARLRPAGDLRAHLDCLSAAFESRLPKAPWTAAKMTPEVLERMMRSIVPVRLAVEEVRSTFKLGQNKPGAARLGAADRIGGSVGSELDALAALMRAP